MAERMYGIQAYVDDGFGGRPRWITLGGDFEHAKAADLVTVFVAAFEEKQGNEVVEEDLYEEHDAELASMSVKGEAVKYEMEPGRGLRVELTREESHE